MNEAQHKVLLKFENSSKMIVKIWLPKVEEKPFCSNCLQLLLIPGHLSATSYVFHPNMLHPLFYTLSISSLILHFSHFLPCLFIPWISSYTISNPISKNSISSQPFYPHLRHILFHPCIFHPTNWKDDMHRMKMKGWICKYEIDKVKNLG